jgi:hypothetical protein
MLVHVVGVLVPAVVSAYNKLKQPSVVTVCGQPWEPNILEYLDLTEKQCVQAGDGFPVKPSGRLHRRTELPRQSVQRRRARPPNKQTEL